MKYFLTAAILFLSLAASVEAGVLEQMRADGSLRLVTAPRFTDPVKAEAFAAKCRALATELQMNYSPTPELTKLHREALMAGEFLSGRSYVMKTTKVPSVVKLREWIKAPPSDEVAYVKIYPSREELPEFIKPAFQRPETRGVTMDGRYVAIIKSRFPQEMQDVLSHEMVHCYLTLSSPKPLPVWFQEGTAVYLSTGKENKFYGREAGVPEGIVSALPEDYKNNLFVFSFLEQKVGRPKVYEFIRKSVESGSPDMRHVGYGFASQKPARDRKPPLKMLAAAGAAVAVAGVVIAVVVAKRREDDF